jgi:DNA invertase Pin-like site-specific DNA recombinase
MNKITEIIENKTKKVLGYVRVSTDEQDVINQELEIRRYCDQHNLKVND